MLKRSKTRKDKLDFVADVDSIVLQEVHDRETVLGIG